MAVVSVTGDTSSHGGAPFNSGASTNVKAGNKGLALAGQTTSTAGDSLYIADPVGHSQGVAANQKANVGSATVFANNKPVHRLGDARLDGTTSGPGVSSVKAG